MTYTLTVKGKAAFRAMDLMCKDCGYEEDRLVSEGETLKCPNCDGEMEQVWRKAPTTRVGGDKSDASIAKMKRSFQERFVKKELDDVRNKYGRLYDDSVRSAAAQKVKSGKNK